MKLLAVADLHFSLKQFDWLVSVAERHDAVLIAGDLLDIAGHLDLDSQIVVITKYLRTLSERTRLFVCSGNHDGDIKNEREEYVARWLQRVRAAGLVTDGAGYDLDGLRLSVCPWWDGPATQAALRDFLEREAASVRGEWLWLHHAPPAGVGVSWTGRGDGGDRELVALIERHQPHYVLSGHIHQSPFTRGGSWQASLGRTRLFNPGQQLGAPPATVTLDLARRTAAWSSQAGDEELQLDAAPVGV